MQDYPIRLVIAALSALLLAPSTPAAAQEAAPARVPIEYEGVSVGHIEELTISATDSESAGRFLIALEASLPGLRRVLDRIGQREGNLVDSSIVDVYWQAGSTRYESFSRNTLRLSTLLRVECIFCLDASVRVRWNLQLEPSGLRSVRAVARTSDFVGVAGWIEKLLDLHQTIQFTLPLLEKCPECMCLQEELSVSQGSTRFAIKNNVVWLRAEYTVDNDLTPGLPCLVD